jgi:hypothetical protein
MTDVLIREIWANDTGAVALAEENAGERSFWCPARTFPPHGVNPGDPGRMYDDTTVGAPANLSADGFIAGPAMHNEHLMEIPTRGYERLYVEWSGECVLSTGYAPAAVGAAGTRTYYTDTVFAVAHGQGYTDPARRYTKYPAGLVRNDAEFGHNFANFSNNTPPGNLDDLHVHQANGKRLYIKGTGINFRGLGLSRGRLASGMNPAVIPATQYASGFPICQGGRFWGYTEWDGGGVGRSSPPVNGTGSRLPRAGDYYGFIVEIGWPESIPIDRGADPSATAYFELGKLTVDAFETVQFASLCVAPDVGVLDYPGPCAHIIKGRMYAILTRPGPGQVIFIDRAGKVVESDASTFQLQGRRRA